MKTRFQIFHESHRKTRVFGISAALLCSLTLISAHAQPPEPVTSLPAQRIPMPLPERKPASATTSKSEIIAKLKLWQSRQMQGITAIEDTSKKLLKDSTTLSLKEDLNVAHRKITRLGDQLQDLEKRRTEMLARREFVDQLVLLIDSKWNGQPLQEFLEHSLLDLAAADLTNPQGASDTWRFLTYMSITIREVPEPKEDLLGVMESYMNFASVLNPRSPAEFLANRNYSNGAVSVPARMTNRENLGEYLEKRNRELGRVSTTGNKPATAKAPMELRLPLNQLNQLDQLDQFNRQQKPDHETKPGPERESNGGVGTETAPAAPATGDDEGEEMYISPRLKAAN